MKKTIILFLAAAALSFMACNEKKSADSNSASATEQSVSEPGEKPAPVTEQPAAEPQQIDAATIEEAARTGQPVTMGEGKNKVTIQARPQPTGKYTPSGVPEKDAQALIDVLRKAVTDKAQAKVYAEQSLDYDAYYNKGDKQLNDRYQKALLNNPEYMKLVQEILKNR